jgi:hypothetical protein
MFRAVHGFEVVGFKKLEASVIGRRFDEMIGNLNYFGGCHG